MLIIAQSRELGAFLEALLSDTMPVCVAHTGHQAMVFAREHPPRLVVIALPLALPSAEATIHGLRIEHGSALPVVAITSAGREHLAAGLGARGIVTAPLDSAELLAMVADACEATAERQARLLPPPCGAVSER
ncbi:MAG: hypothetical protein JO247_07270 [Chloroflexi bacterium]|nr:hypothetical protein [Chloroflexota bacterium]